MTLKSVLISFKLVPFESLGAVSYSPSIVTMALSRTISEIKQDIGRKSLFLPRDAMRKRGLCRHTVSVCLSVCVSVTFVDCVKTNKDIFIFSPSGSHAILVFLHQTGWQYSEWTPQANGGVVCRWGRLKS